MADSKLDALTAESTLDGTERVYIVKDYTGTPADRKTTVDDLKTYIGAGGGGGASVSIGSTPPVSPTAGDLWWDDVNGKLYIYYNDGSSSQWVEAAGGSSGAMVKLSSGSISSPVQYIDVSLDGNYTRYQIALENFHTPNGYLPVFVFSLDGETYLADIENVDTYIFKRSPSFDPPNTLSSDAGIVLAHETYSTHNRICATVDLFPGDDTVYPRLVSNGVVDDTYYSWQALCGGTLNVNAIIPPPPASRLKSIRLTTWAWLELGLPAADVLISGNWTLYGVK